MSIDIDKLEALAREATDGPWSMAKDGSPVVNAGGRAAHLIGPPGSDEAVANTEFVVAADPEVVLALIARLREAEAREQALALWREEVQSHIERDGVGGDQWQDELVELAADGLSLESSLARRDAKKQAEGVSIAQAAFDNNMTAQYATKAWIDDLLEGLECELREQADTAGEES